MSTPSKRRRRTPEPPTEFRIRKRDRPIVEALATCLATLAATPALDTTFSGLLERMRHRVLALPAYPNWALSLTLTQFAKQAETTTYWSMFVSPNRVNVELRARVPYGYEFHTETYHSWSVSRVSTSGCSERMRAYYGNYPLLPLSDDLAHVNAWGPNVTMMLERYTVGEERGVFIFNSGELSQEECDRRGLQVLSTLTDPARAAEVGKRYDMKNLDCDMCHRKLDDFPYMVDARLRAAHMFGYLCPGCFFIDGTGLGMGFGQLYEREGEGLWLMVGGFPDWERRDDAHNT
jgi:hypothetical protein